MKTNFVSKGKYFKYDSHKTCHEHIQSMVFMLHLRLVVAHLVPFFPFISMNRCDVMGIAIFVSFCIFLQAISSIYFVVSFPKVLFYCGSRKEPSSSWKKKKKRAHAHRRNRERKKEIHHTSLMVFGLDCSISHCPFRFVQYNTLSLSFGNMRFYIVLIFAFMSVLELNMI